MTSAEDALYAAAMGADAVGFIFAPSSRQMTPGRVKAIVPRLPGDLLTVGVFRNESKERVVEIMNATGLRVAQLHGNESPDDTRWVADNVQAVIRGVPAGSRALVEHEQFGHVRFLIDSPSPGSGEVFDWSVLEDAPLSRGFILAGGLNPENVGEAIATVRPWGVDVASGVEERPGVKDPSLVRSFITNARSMAEMLEGGDSELDRDGPYNWEEDAAWR